MRFIPVVLLFTLTLACGGGTSQNQNQPPPCPSSQPGCPGYVAPPTDYAPALVGFYVGSAVVTINGVTTPVSSSAHVSYLATNLIRINDTCADGSGPSASVSAGGNFAIEPGSCAPTTVGQCSSVVFSIASGSGTVSGSNATAHIAG